MYGLWLISCNNIAAKMRSVLNSEETKRGKN